MSKEKSFKGFVRYQNSRITKRTAPGGPTITQTNEKKRKIDNPYSLMPPPPPRPRRSPPLSHPRRVTSFVMSKPTEPMVGVAFTPSGKFSTAGLAAVRVWDIDSKKRIWGRATGLLLQTQVNKNKTKQKIGFTSVAISPDGKRVTAGIANMVYIADRTKNPALFLNGHHGGVTSVVFSGDGKQIVSGSSDKTVRVWDSVTGAQIHELKGHTDPVMSVAFSWDGKYIVSGGEDKTVRVWDSATGAQIHELKGHTDPVMSVAFSWDGEYIVSGGEDKTVRVWDSATGAQIHELKGHTGWVTSVAFSPDGKQIASGDQSGVVRLFDMEYGLVGQLRAHNGRVLSVAYLSGGGKIVSGGMDKKIVTWDIQ